MTSPSASLAREQPVERELEVGEVVHRQVEPRAEPADDQMGDVVEPPLAAAA